MTRTVCERFRAPMDPSTIPFQFWLIWAAWVVVEPGGDPVAHLHTQPGVHLTANFLRDKLVRNAAC